MSLLTATDLSKFYGADEVFSGVHVDLPHGARVALVGPNGAGKSTLLRILIGEDAPSEGRVQTARAARVGYLPQNPVVDGAHTLWHEAMRALAPLRAREAELHTLAAQLADGDPALLERYGALEAAFAAEGGYTYEQRARRVLAGLGFHDDDHTLTLDQLSGGQKTRAALARLLLEAPTLLALDEPTNHLDLQAVMWLEGTLAAWDGAVIVVSHDRAFLDAVANTVWELDFGTLQSYRGNYSAYVQQRTARRERLLSEFEAQQAFITKEEDYIRRNIAGQNTRQAQGRRTRLERLRRDGLVRAPQSRRTVALALESSGRANLHTITTRGLQVGYTGAPAPLLTVPDLRLARGEVAVLTGPNGVGKSTFVKTIIGALPPYAGEVTLGNLVRVAYFAQAHEGLDPTQTIIEAVLAAQPMSSEQARGYLAPFLFTGDDVFQTIGVLSGGERGRVALAVLGLSGANLLLLDEPTNHLDVDSQEVLQHVLAAFGGTILMVSHDRAFIDALATQIWDARPATTPGQPATLRVFHGNHRDYVAAQAAEAQAAADAEAATRAAQAAASGVSAPRPVAQAPAHGLNPYQHRKRVTAVEEQIGAHEAALAALEADLAAASALGDAARVQVLGQHYTETQAALDAAMQEWEHLLA